MISPIPSQPPAATPTYTLWSLSSHPVLPLLVSAASDRSLRFYALCSPVSSNNNGGDSTSAPNDGGAVNLELRHINTVSTSHTRSLRSVAFNETGDKLACGSFDSSISIWERAEGEEDSIGEWEEREMLEGMENEVKAVRWRTTARTVATDEEAEGGGGWLAACGRDKSVWVWEVIPETNEYEVAAVCLDHEQDVKSIAWHPKEDLLVSASYDCSMHFYSESSYDAEWSSHQHIPSAHKGTVWSVSFSTDGEFLVSGGDDDDGGGEVRWWCREKIASTSSSIRVGRGEKERWRLGGVVRMDETEEEKRGPVVVVDWKDEYLLVGQRDGRIEVFRTTIVEGKMNFVRIGKHEKAHGDFDLNHLTWIRYRPKEFIKGGKWNGIDTCFASCGDDGFVRVWTVSNESA
ncbi:WD40 repeat-like protein [Atractiella rhizophila]|nr:WD40 repeat-like protein [Atractiella rhizophila]